MDESNLLKLDVTLYGDVEPLSSTLSKCRVRVFYKGLNRNRTFISDSFAQQLIDSMPYAPIKGIFKKDELDFDDHGESNADGRVYGIIPENPNFAWEKHIDCDGVEREYACADVFLYSALYPEANLIVGKSQSMEIHKNGLTGEWKIWAADGQPYYEFYSGHLLGLQVLGNEVEPCFEGSAFFSLYKEAKDLLDYIRKFSIKEEESKKMDKNLFRLSDNEKCELLFNALNVDADSFTMICDIYDDYAVAYDTVNKKYIRAYYTKDNEANSVSIDKIEDCYIVDVTETELNAINAMKAIGTYSEIQEKFNKQVEQISEQEKKIEELTEEINKFTSTAQEEESSTDVSAAQEEGSTDASAAQEEIEAIKADFAAKINEKDEKIKEIEGEIIRLNKLNTDITNEKVELENFKKQIEMDNKEKILDEFSTYLTESQISQFKESMANFSVVDFKKEVCTTAYESDSSMFKPKEENLIYTGDSKVNETGALKLLNKHRGGNR